MSPLLLLATTLIATLWLTALLLHAGSELRRAEEGQRCLDAITELRRLFEYLPQHRGAANALLQGDASFKAKLEQLKQRIDSCLGALAPFFDSHPSQALEAKWQTLTTQWGQLKSSLNTMPAPESFQHHTALITQTIHLIDDLATNTRLKAAPAYERGPRGAALTELSRILFSQLLFTTEFMARARGVGAGAASQGRVSTANRVKLGFLQRKIEEMATSTLKQLARLLPTHPQLAPQRELLDESQHAALGFARLLKTELLECQRIEITPSAYFDSGTAAIGKSLRLFDSLFPAIREAAETTLRQARSRLTRTWTGSAITVATLAWLWSSLEFSFY